MTADLNGDSVDDEIEILETGYSTVFDNGENGGFTLPGVRATVSGDVHTLQLSCFRGYRGIKNAFIYPLDNGKDVLFACLDMGGNHFGTTAIYAVGFDGGLGFLPLPQSNENYTELYPNACCDVAADAEFDIGNFSVTVSNGGLGLLDTVFLDAGQIDYMKNNWDFSYTVTVYTSNIHDVELVKNGDDCYIGLSKTILLQHNVNKMAVGVLVSELKWENGSFAVTDQKITPCP